MTPPLSHVVSLFLLIFMTNLSSGQVSTVPLAAFPSGACEAWEGEPTACGGSIFFDDNQVFVTDGTSQSGVAAFIAPTIAGIELAPEPCRSTSLPYTCLSSYPTCTVIEGTAVPRPICRSMCELLLQDCGAFFDPVYNPAPNCTTLPTTGINVQSATDTYFVPCVGGLDVDPTDPVVATAVGDCEPWEGSTPECEDEGMDPDADVFVPTGVSQSIISAAIADTVALIQLAPAACRSASMEMTCLQSFGQCVTRRNGMDFPQPLCRSVCEDVLADCAGLFNAANPAPNCTNFPEFGYMINDADMELIECAKFADGLAAPSPTPSPTPVPPTGGRCEEYIGAPECAGIVDGLVFVPDGTTQREILDQNAVNFGAIDLAPASCKGPSKSFRCRSIFPGCIENAAGGGISLPPCRDLCTDLIDGCGDLIQSSGFEVPDCDATTDEGPLYPVGPAGCAGLGGEVTRLLPSGRCEPWDGEPKECAEVIQNRQVFVPFGTNQSVLASFLDGQLDLLIYASLACREPSLVLACGSVFPPCFNYTTGDTVTIDGEETNRVLAVYQPVCRKVCKRANDKCELSDDMATDCYEDDIVTGDKYPRDTFEIFVANGTFSNVSTFECYNPSIGSLTDPSCPWPLVFDDDVSRSEAPCVIPCPDPIWDEGGDDWIYDYYKNMAIFVGIPGLALSILSILALVGFPYTRSWPRSCVIHLVIAQAILGIAFFVQVVYGYYDTLCEDDVTFADQSFFPCGFTGTLLVFSTCFQESWYFCICLNLFIRVVLEKRDTSWLFWPFQALTLLFSIGVTATALGLDDVQYTPGGSSVCFFINPEKPWRDIGILYIPIQAMVTAGALLTTIALLKMLYYMQKQAGSRRAARSFFQRYWRLLIFIYYWSVQWSIIFYVRIDGEQRSDAISDEYGRWIECEFATGDDDEDSSCSMGEKPRIVLMALQNAFAHTGSIVLFFMFVCKMSVFNFWKAVFLEVKKGNSEGVKNHLNGSGGSTTWLYGNSKSNVEMGKSSRAPSFGATMSSFDSEDD